MQFTDTCDIGNIAFSERVETQDVAYVGRFDRECTRHICASLPDATIHAVKLAVMFFLAKYTRLVWSEGPGLAKTRVLG